MERLLEQVRAVLAAIDVPGEARAGDAMAVLVRMRAKAREGDLPALVECSGHLQTALALKEPRRSTEARSALELSALLVRDTLR